MNKMSQPKFFKPISIEINATPKEETESKVIIKSSEFLFNSSSYFFCITCLISS